MLYGTGKWCRVLIDATVNLDFEPRKPMAANATPDGDAPRRDMDLVNSRWEEYGFEPRGEVPD